MIHNDVDYWRHLEHLKPGDPDLPSPRICRLLRRLFQRWREKPRWLTEEQVGHLIPGPTGDPAERKALSGESVMVRKGKAVRRMLQIIVRDDVAASAGSFELDPDDLIFGTMPPFSVGQGKEFVRYLKEDEELAGMLDFLNEMSPMGHIAPDHGRTVRVGLRKMIDDCKAKAAASEGARERDFYLSVIESLEGVVEFAHAYAHGIRKMVDTLPADDARRPSLVESAARLERVPEFPAESFHDAVQAIHLLHCAFHWTVEIVPIGRLDQILWPILEKELEAKQLTLDQAQEILDGFWIKLDEPAILNYRHAENRFTACDGVLTGFWGSSNYDQGGLLNQWMQQITIGGLLPKDGDPQDACNPVTRLCLNSSRRLPLNSPTLDLRVNGQTPKDVLDLAAAALLSGGAHPVLLSDECIVKALTENSNNVITLADARDYACDGCYETMVAGKSEFSFGFVSATDLIEKTLNRGAGIAGTGPINLRGSKESWRSTAASDIKDWDEFKRILEKHLELGCHRYVKNLTLNYGNKEAVCPSPLLSAFIGGCLESGRDLTAGGTDYHIFSPLFTSISTAADSLHVIRKLVFEEKKFTLEELLTCLTTNWGDALLGPDGAKQPAFGRYVSPERIQEIHALCKKQDKFGYGHAEVDKIAWYLIDSFCNAVRDAAEHPVHAGRLKDLAARWSSPGKDFQLIFAPGVGTFEQYVFSGSWLGASADGRKSRQPIASDLSPAPLHSEEDPMLHRRTAALAKGFASYSDECMERLGDGGAVDYNLPEDFPPDKLAALLGEFAQGGKGSVATFTVANPKTLLEAQTSPEKYNLVRVRMGGWSEFFVTLFPDHQNQHRRRPLYTP
ncbi:pyruvate-formate lyase [Haloferula luteola]|uniref:Pyruvate-formate lyase n=1 Tax=Haloferula luteola TaxID=595692 RepID=A0A840V7R0_9BACT|nr:pyruvate formate lyase family protein [Haloferula luteola]MBB5351624.1 pyruvate-formate lyase [Haloferula luteola]